MTVGKNVFYLTDSTCPVCLATGQNYLLKSKIFVPEKVDTDNYVISYLWLDHNYQQCHPSVFALWICSSCSYVDFPERFKSLLKNSPDDFSVLKENVLKEKSLEDGILNKLSCFIEITDKGLDFDKAIMINLLAIYIHENLAERQNSELLGRLCLRLSWLFRDRAKYETQEVPIGDQPNLGKYLQSLKPLWGDLPFGEIMSLKKAALYYSQILNHDFPFDEIIKNIRLIYLAAELYLKLNDYAQASELLHAVLKLGIDLRSKLTHGINARKKEKLIKLKEERMVRAKIYKINDELIDVRDRFDEINQRWLAYHADDIESVRKSTSDYAIDVRLRKLRNKGIPEKVIEMLTQRDPFFQEPKKKKKGIFDFLRKKEGGRK